MIFRFFKNKIRINDKVTVPYSQSDVLFSIDNSKEEYIEKSMYQYTSSYDEDKILEQAWLNSDLPVSVG